MPEQSVAGDAFDGVAGRLRDRFTAALRTGDASAATQAYADEAWLIPPAAELLRGRGAIAEYWQAGLDAGIDDVSLAADGFDLYDNVAVEFGRYVVSLGMAEGAPVTERGRYVVVCAKQPDGEWRWASQLMSPRQG